MKNRGDLVSGSEDWIALRRHTPARIALGRAGYGLPVKAHLEFQAAHSRARDAVKTDLDVDALAKEIKALGWPVLSVRSAAPNREVFLRRPDFGRLLSDESRALLSEPAIAPDIAIVIGDGLSSVAVERNALPLLKILYPGLQHLKYRLGPVIVATQARVAIADQIGELLQAKASIILIGERPGLSAADSLGLYLTYGPRIGRVDSERNCISNIRAGGAGAEEAAKLAADLVRSMFARRVSGVQLAAARAQPREIE